MPIRNRDGVCMAGLVKKDGCSGGLDIHHIITRGAGGGNEPENLITLCRRHHHDAHAGRLSVDYLRSILRRYYGYTYANEEGECNGESQKKGWGQGQIPHLR
jgi:5-methylcytosine-specific restriction endonuclease McrA